MFSCVKWEVRLLILKVKVRNKDKDNIMMKCQMKYHELLLGRRIWAILLVFFFLVWLETNDCGPKVWMWGHQNLRSDLLLPFLFVTEILKNIKSNILPFNHLAKRCYP